MLNINSEKHFKYVENHLRNALDGIQQLHKQTLAEKDSEYYQNIRRILEIAVNWYENNDINYYTFFQRAFKTDMGPTEFYGGLGSFLVNTLLDDSYYKICWEKYSNGGFVEGEVGKDSPYVVWAGDDDGISNPKEMLNAMLYLIQKDKEREELEKKLQEMMTE